MNKLIFLFTGIILISITSINAQNIQRVDQIEIVNSQVNNVSVQIKTAEFAQAVLNNVNQTNVNAKAGFNTQFNTDNTLLTLNLTKAFNENELNTLLEYTGIKLNSEDFNHLYNLVNQ